MKDLISQINNQRFIGLPEVAANDNQLRNGLAIVFGVAASIAVLVIIISAINYATAGDDPEKISKNRKSIILALVGLAISLSAEVIVLTILDRF